MVGVLPLFRYGMPYRVRRGGASFLILNDTDKADLKQEKLYDALGLLGLVLVILGTVCQIVAKRVQFDDETWEAITAVSRSKGKSFQELADEAFADLLKKHKQPVGLKAALKESVGSRPKEQRGRSS